jgi:hypothetical protein
MEASMDVSHFLNSHLLDPKVGGKRLWADMLEQAVHAEACGFRGVTIPEHHLLNILLIPSPLQFAVAVAARTKRIEVASSICQLPIRDMRIFAGEVVQAQALCGGRLVLGVGKGAFGFETGRLGVPMEETKPRFEESLAVLEALLTQEEVSWDGQWYKFDALTVMPRPEDPIPLALAIMAPPGIEAAAAKGLSHPDDAPVGQPWRAGGAGRGLPPGQGAVGQGAAAAVAAARGLSGTHSRPRRRRMVEKAYTLLRKLRQCLRRAGDRGPRDHQAPCPAPRRWRSSAPIS